jgi:hypothetical protein
MIYILKVWDGDSNRTREISAESYKDAMWQAGVDWFPPAYIWSIEPKENA